MQCVQGVETYGVPQPGCNMLLRQVSSCVQVTSWPGLRGDEWINDATRLAGLRKFADDKEFQGKWRAIKLENKKRLAAKIKARPLLPGWLVLGGDFSRKT